MKAGTFSNTLQILTSIGLLAGIGLVVYELRQNSNIAVAEVSVAGGFDSALAVHHQFLSDGRLMPAYVKACLNEEELTEQEILVMDGYLNLEFLLLVRIDMVDDAILDAPNVGNNLGVNQAVASRIRATAIGEGFAQKWFREFADGKYAYLLEHEVMHCKDIVAGYQEGIARRAAN
jgi:hypothetical protein